MTAETCVETDMVTAAEVLVKHQGPFFDGTVERCQCREIVCSGQEWAEHVAAQLAGGT